MHPTTGSPPDAIVIGAGPNGLVAANHLADHGWRVVVLEASSTPGGAVRSAELIEPGYVHDLCSAFYPLAARSRALLDLSLEDHGLRWLHAPTVLAHPAADGSCPVLSRDLDVTAASLDADRVGDGDAWRRLYRRWIDLEPDLLDTFLSPMPPVRGSARLVRRLGVRELARFARFALLPVRRLGEEEFAGESARRLLAGAALHADMAPEAALSGFLGWLLCSLGQGDGFPVPEGGAQSVTAALVRRLEGLGGAVVCDAPVGRVVVEGGRARGVELVDGSPVVARRAVLADVNAPMLYRRLVAAEHLPSSVLADVDRFHWDDGTFKVDWTLDGPIPWSAEPARRAGTVHITEGVDALTVSTSELARGLVPADPFLLVGQQSMTDPTRQPAGRETAWAYTHVPRHVRGDAGGEVVGDWGPSDVARFTERIEARIEALAPGFGALVRGRHVLSPTAFEEENPNLDHGAINGGTAQLHQQLVFRPTPGSGRATTPVKGLFLASASAHPGGGLHGAPGRNAARAAVAADRFRVAAVVIGRRASGR
ncbi:MAG: crtI [Acidimicrobiales bacterium]|nr:crtI [Acidimicrobiales bacterium]